MRALAHAYEGKNLIGEAQDVWQVVNKSVGGGDREATVKIRDLSAKSMTTLIESATVSGKRGSASLLSQTEEQSKERLKLARSENLDIKSDDDLKAAIQDAKDELVGRPDDPRVYAKLGELYQKAKDFPAAKSALESAIQKDPNNPSWQFKLHDLEIAKMLTGLRELKAKADAGDIAARDSYAQERHALLDYRLKSFLDREKQYSTDSRIRFELGLIYFDLAREKGADKGFYDEAIKRFQSTFRDPKYHVESGLRMGLGFAAKQQYDLALKRFDETLSSMEFKNEQWKSLKYAKGDTLVRSGRRAEAKAVFLEVYEIDVSYRDVGKRVEDLSKEDAPSQAN